MLIAVKLSQGRLVLASGNPGWQRRDQKFTFECVFVGNLKEK